MDSVTVRDGGGGRLYQEGADYRLVQRGDFVEIQRVAGGRIPEDGAVQVDYTAANEADERVSTTETFNALRLELFERMLVLETHLRRVDTMNEVSIAFQDLTEKEVSAEWHWKWFMLGVEYQDYAADFLSYDDLRFRQGIVLGEGSWLTTRLEFAQSRADYDQLNDQRETDSIHFSLRARVTPQLQIQLLGEEYREEGDFSDRTLTRGTSNLQYRIGDIATSLSYNYEEESVDSEDRKRHHLYVTSKRTF